MFVQLVCSIQYRVVKENADDAFYELQNPREQIQAYVFDGQHSALFANTLIESDIVFLLLKVPNYTERITLAFDCSTLVIRALVPRMTLDELFEQKGEVAKSVLEELDKVSHLLRAYQVVPILTFIKGFLFL